MQNEAHHLLSSDFLDINALGAIVQQGIRLELSEESQNAVAHCYDYLQNKIRGGDRLFYGINTGFGALCNIGIEADQLEALQHNLVRSHACGMGEEVAAPVVRLMLLLKIQNLLYGYSGIQPSTLARLIDMYNEDLLPVVYQLGSLGASGDLAPLAHLSLPLLGEGEVYDRGQRCSAAQALERRGWQPLRLGAKEGLALLNGTQFSLSYGVYAWLRLQSLSQWADCIAALSLDAFACSSSPFDERLHRIRPHVGQLETAAAVRYWLEDSPHWVQAKTTVQDPYAFRCIPQVHGASKDALWYVRTVLETEINSVTDNPMVFPDDDLILSGGNFHAQPLALALDFLAIAASEWGSISERRVFQLISGQRGLPAFLTRHSGLHSGLMIAQYTAAAIASQNKQLCTPASVDSIVSSNGQEDHVSMAANAATKLLRVADNVERLLGIELLTAAQALSLRPEPTSSRLRSLLTAYRQAVPVLEGDRQLSPDMHASVDFMRGFDLRSLMA